jgi:WD40 repeat protein
MSVPVVLLAFADDRTGRSASLREELAKERREIRAIFAEAERAGLCEAEILADATPADVVRAFQHPAWRDRVAVFHFSGHADSERLLFEAEDGGAAAAAGMDLAEFLGQQKALTLVFLNGCGTEGHVEALLNAGVQAVVGARRKIDSVAACEFAIAFYRALARGRRSLREAFEEAQAGAYLIGGASARGLSYAGGASVAAPARAPAWVLHIRSGAEAVNAWRFDPNPLFGLPLPEDIGFPSEPFLNLRGFGREHARIFFGRGRLIRALRDTLTDPAAEPVVLLCGQSGVGKSSLLYAGLLPRLEARFAVVTLERPPAFGAVALLRKKIGAGTTLAEAWLRREREEGRPLLVAIDHAESLLPDNGATRENWESLRAEWAALFQGPGAAPRGKLLLAFRKEWLAEIAAGLDRRKLPHACRVVERLDRAGAIEAIEGAVREPRCQARYRLSLAPDRDGQPLAARIAAELLADRHAPVAPTLQILLSRLWKRAKAANEAAPVIDAELYEEEKRRGLLLDDFLRERLAELESSRPSLAESGLALDILQRHTDELGGADECFLSQLELEYAHCRSDLLAALDFFKACFVLADATGPGRDAPKSTRLAHDTLAPLVRREYERSDRPGQRARRILEERAKRGASLPLEDLATVERGELGMRLWTGEERRMVEAARRCRAATRRRRLRLRSALAGLALALAASAGTIAWQWWEGLRYRSLALAENARREAERGHAALGVLLALEALPSADHLRPWTERAETALAFALSQPWETAPPPHPGRTLDAAFSPDGSRLATVGEQGARLWNWVGGRWDGKAGKVLQAGKVHQAAFSADGHYLVTVSEDGYARVWEAGSGTEALRIRQDGEALQAEFSPRGDMLATRGQDGNLRFWRGISAALAKAKNSAAPIEIAASEAAARLAAPGGRVRHFAYSPDGARIALAVGKDASILDADSGQELRRFPHSQPLTRIGFSPDGKRLATATAGGMAWVWDAEDGKKLLRLNHGDAVEAVAFSPDGRRLATAARDKTARIWSLASGKEALRLELESPAWRAAFAADGKTLAVVAETGLSLRNVAHGVEAFRAEHRASVEYAEFSRDGRRIATASLDGGARILDARDGRELLRLEHGGGVNQASFDPEGGRLATASADGFAKIWDARTGRELLRLAHGAGVRLAAFDAAGERLLSASEDGTARIWDAETGAERLRLAHDGPVRDAAFSPDGQWILAASADGTARLWNARSGQERFRWQHGGAVKRVAFSPDGHLAATASADRAARLFDLANGQEHGRLAHSDSVESVAFSPDGRWLATASADRGARIWNAGTGAERWRLPHGQALSYAAFSADSRHLVTALRESLGEETRDTGARVWDVATGQERFAIPHDAAVTRALFSPDGQGILTVSPDKTARFWALGHLLLEGWELVEFARTHGLPRPALTQEERRRFFLDGQ